MCGENHLEIQRVNNYGWRIRKGSELNPGRQLPSLKGIYHSLHPIVPVLPPVLPLPPAFCSLQNEPFAPVIRGLYIFFFVCVCITPGRLIADLRVSLSLWFPTPMPAGEDGEMGGGEGQSLLPTPPPTFHSLYTMAGSANQLSLPGRH